MRATIVERRPGRYEVHDLIAGRWSIVVEGPAPTRHDDEDAFDAAIDAAMENSNE